MRFSKTAVFAGFAGLASAQTFTDCDPTNKTCPADPGLNKASYSVDFTKGASSDWTLSSSSLTYSASTGAAFTINEAGNAPTLTSNFYIFFGRVSVLMRASPGQGIVSSIVLESDDLDEVDWEWIGGQDKQVQTDYFGKGNTTAYDRGTVVDLDAGTQSTFRNYTLVWTEASIVWYLDGSLIRTLTYEQALGGKNFPQTPMQVKIGSWAGGASENAAGTIEWAGGLTNYSAGPYTMYVKSVEIENYNPGASYTYGDLSGSYSSIIVSKANSTESSSAEETIVTASSTKASSTKTATSASKATSTPKIASNESLSSNSTISSPDSASESESASTVKPATESASTANSTVAASSTDAATVTVSGASSIVSRLSLWAAPALLAVAVFNL
ncbi:MAG: transglycosylase [Sporothrix thermara]